MIKTIICDDHAIVREGLRHLLSSYSDITVIDDVKNGFDLREKLKTLECDVLVTDLSMPGGGVDLIKEIHADHPRLHILVLSMHTEDHFAMRVFKAGAIGYLSKTCAGEEVAEAVRTVAAGSCFLTKKSSDLFIAALNSKNKKSEGHECLSDREFEILLGIGEGRPLTEIGDSLGLSVKTVSTYRARVLNKLNLAGNADLVHYVLSHGLTEKFKDREVESDFK